MAVQAEKAMANIAMLLDECGSKLEDICKITVYLVDIRYREPVYNVIGKWLKGVFPVSTGLCGLGACAAGVAGRDRRDRSDSAC